MQAKNALCIVRPPGHHAGPVGKVTCKNDMSGSSGFCLLNNIAIGAAYAVNMYRTGKLLTSNLTILFFHAQFSPQPIIATMEFVLESCNALVGVKRVAILDFDVHHGNGTEACVKATQPSTRKVTIWFIDDLPNAQNLCRRV